MFAMPQDQSPTKSLLALGVGLIVCSAATSGCKTTEAKKASNLPANNKEVVQLPEEEAPEPETFHYCPVNAVKPSSAKSGGLAALTTVLNYWDLDAEEPALLKKYPPAEEAGYPMPQLRRIATDEGLMAFSLTMKMKPLEQLSEQLEHGRPVLVSVRFANGEYFGKPTSVVEDLAKGSGVDVGAITNSGEYYVVVFGQSDNQLLIMDPTLGVVSIDKEAFAKYWKEEKYSALLCSSF